jgi:uncharacterized NAD-dependent epimerase/dehydratase family protein
MNDPDDRSRNGCSSDKMTTPHYCMLEGYDVVAGARHHVTDNLNFEKFAKSHEKQLTRPGLDEEQ